MTKRHNPPQERTSKKGGKFLPALCNILGTLILLAVIALVLPLSVPKLMGYQVYNVISGSMEPAIPVGSMIFVKPVDGSEIQPDEIIAFQSGDSVVTHRVLENHVVEAEFITKGDANADEDLSTIPYNSLIGAVRRHVPMLGDIMMHVTTTVGKVYLLALVACGLMFNILASRLRV